MKPKTKFLLGAFSAALLTVGSASADTIIYQDQFGYGPVAPGTPINGQHPDTVDTGVDGGTPNAVWDAASQWVANGSGANSQASAQAIYSSGYLPFIPQTDQIYTLSASLSGDRDENVYLGFTQNNNPNSNWLDNQALFAPPVVNPGPFVQFVSDTGDLNVYPGPASQNAPAASESEGSSSNGTYFIVLDTSAPNWTYSVTGPGFSTGPLTFPNGNPTINYVGIGDYSDAGTSFANVDHFTLSVAPEPSTYMLLGLGILALFFMSRRCASRKN
jgi:hypothetical protein